MSATASATLTTAATAAMAVTSASANPTQQQQVAACFAAPGSYCTPYGQILLCSQDRYCPGGVSPPLRCPSGKWSPAGAMFLEDCSDHMNVELGVLVSLLLIIFALCLCWWWTRFAFKVDYGDDNSWRRDPSYNNNNGMQDRRGTQPWYGACGQYPAPSPESHRISVTAQPIPPHPITTARYSRVATGPLRV